MTGSPIDVAPHHFLQTVSCLPPFPFNCPGRSPISIPGVNPGPDSGFNGSCIPLITYFGVVDLLSRTMMYVTPPRIKSPTAMPTDIPILAPLERGEDEEDMTARGIIFSRAGERAWKSVGEDSDDSVVVSVVVMMDKVCGEGVPVEIQVCTKLFWKRG
ncbi:hypothetical protein DL98DRAFT_510259 [Cadophora sp. DSE1049]|nr:hypothetical protein DL98DRAFT_510259 [Cadophora sp. DSE1049]